MKATRTSGQARHGMPHGHRQAATRWAVGAGSAAVVGPRATPTFRSDVAARQDDRKDKPRRGVVPLGFLAQPTGRSECQHDNPAG